ncbi:oxygen-dependent coproporphyrinogen oxidase [Puia dinghuensis]|uniref:coproporphyrinogen oxidase n=1 Tax=Puia dinghuensis TaxID=1792502 RepID=A0A8J2UGV9_9BACT|nr:oxygen-dependent coproporphyrinogen oxidase [Puia dinghuensis]GGB13606.1 coproporphyrinogen oxidase [Puia dinghuensis]
MNQPDGALYKTETWAFREHWIDYILGLQDRICIALADLDGKSSFVTDEWEREQGGGGKTRIITNGRIFEKGGVNTSVVWGKVTDVMRTQLKIEGKNWFACGLSLVIHPVNPYVPTTHANWRYFELYNEAGHVTDRWFGGGADLTPYYLFREDARHFHRSFKMAMDPFDPTWYPKYKKWCDEYFVNKHRDNEMRGIGGVFYDHLRPADAADADRLFAFQQANGNAFVPAYLPIAEKRAAMPYGERELEWQEIRRGRYVEFNLIHDRGTLFGLKTNGRTESILMSLPPRARWGYNYQPEEGSPEADLLDACLHPRDWAKE